MMQNFYTNLTPNTIRGDVIIGFFDIIHKGHLLLFEHHKNASIITFKNVPRKINIIQEFDTRITQLRDLGFKNIYVVDLEKNNMSAKSFVDNYLNLVDTVIVGEDFVLGNDHLPIQVFKDELHLELIHYDKNYSTTKIRELLKDGKIQDVNEMLISPFCLNHIVNQGNQQGRLLGFPTVNFNYPNGSMVGSGVYLSKTLVDNIWHPSVTISIKDKNVKGQTLDVVETHILDYEKDLYNQNITICLLERVGNLKLSNSFEDLKKIIHNYVLLVKSKIHGY